MMNSMLIAFGYAALAAGKAIVEIRAAGATTSYKSDRSPVTEADEAAEAIILEALARLYPEIPVIAEESASRGHIPAVGDQPFFLVDPLDGTREFINGHDDFTVNIALIRQGVPVAGFVYAPALGLAYCGAENSITSKLLVTPEFTIVSRSPIRCLPMRQPPIAVASRSHRTPATDDFLSRTQASDIRSIGSSLKFCLLAEGDADIYPRFGRTMEWDTAAGDAILRSAGGRTLNLDGTPLRYGKTGQSDDADFANPDFIAYGAEGGE
jgi:3'(2'), 5'-bisphosphate nucleotidase